ncbi:MAG: hypothetical protein R3185_01375 [Candidatus Thermoplasmatota archaeon]|nr:hypothetical protein [Candidatus Thermoplasmatota archaeon]
MTRWTILLEDPTTGAQACLFSFEDHGQALARWLELQQEPGIEAGTLHLVPLPVGLRTVAITAENVADPLVWEACLAQAVAHGTACIA